MKRRNLLILLGVLIISLLGTLLYYFLTQRESGGEEQPVEVKELDSIAGYDYSLEDRDTALYKEIFKELQEILSKEEIDYKSYATCLAKIYIVDLYTISNKMNKYDIGGVDFLEESARANFVLKVEDTIYRYVEDNSYGKRTQELPEVSSIDLVEIKEEKVKVGEQSLDGFSISLSWKYVKDLGYDKEAIVKVFKRDGKLYIASQNVSQQ